MIDRFHKRSVLLASQKGFTLIEIIVTLILVGISAAIMFPVMGTSLIRSAEPVKRVNDHHLLIQEMDKWTGVYRNEIQNTGTVDIALFKLDVDANASLPVSTSYVNSFGAYNTQGFNKILQVTLTNNGQTLVALFTE